MRESSIERRLTKEVRDRGGMSVKIMPVVAGTPDRLILMPGGLMYLVETKSEHGELRPVQEVWHDRAEKIGTKVVVLTSVADVVEWLESVCGV